MVFHQAVWDEPLLSELGGKGRVGITLPSYQQIDSSFDEKFVPAKLRRKQISLPKLSQPEVVRHFIHLSQMNFGVDLGPYFLGSCTMKHNPKISERIAGNYNFTELHPYQDEDSIQGILQIFYELSGMLAEITGTDKVSLSPAAGAHGEFVGALIIRKHLEEIGEKQRDEMLIPDSAHGTNPATAAMAGFKVVKIPSDEEGLVDVEALKSSVSNKTAGMMLTVPNTHGLFEKNIKEICSIVRDAGGLTYYDGANMNAILGRARPGDMGFDIVHLNLHKTFATPHGGGGPGSGPVGVRKYLAEYLPIPLIAKKGKRFTLDYNVSKSIGRIKNFYGNSGLLLRAYVYIRMFGRDGLPQISGQAVLAANYLLAKIRNHDYALSHTIKAPVKHEFVVSVKALASSTGVRAMDIAKAILDEGLHSPTTYFPLTVEEDLMIEPTETEPLSALDRYAEVLKSIAETAHKDPAKVLESPKNTAVGRLDEVKANHPLTLTLNWRKLVR